MKRLSTLPCLAFIFSLIFPFSNSIAQQANFNISQRGIGFCAQSHVHKRAMRQSLDLQKRQADIEKRAYQFFQKQMHIQEKTLADFTLPVVVHIIHNNGAENIPDAVVLQGIQDLNDAYANVGYYNPATGVDTRIQFCLAKRDPDGNATTGINRVQSTLTDMTLETDDITVKDLSRWDPLHYINIWLVKEICSSSVGCGVAGYAYFPSSHGSPEDGIVMEAAFFGSTPGGSGVQVHEMGHYLGLYHTFQGGCTNNDCLADGDRVCDTPPDQSTAAVPCGGTANSCSTDANSGFATDQNDLYEDYMDYGDFNCWSVFTQGQTDRMHFHIENVRFSLLESQGCQDPCTSALTSSFTASTNLLDVGSTVNFINNSTNMTSAEWSVGGVPFANTTDASYTFNQEGVFEICLTVGNVDPNCSDMFCEEITVTCPVQSEFSADIFYPNPGEMVNYTNSSLNASQFDWTINGTSVGTSQNLTWTFADEGIYDVCLTASNGLCEREFCLPVFVSQGVTDGCEQSTFVKLLGGVGTDEEGMTIIPSGDGNLYLGGLADSKMLLVKMDISGNPIWQRFFDFTPNDEIVQQLMVDSDGNLVGCGFGRGGSTEVPFVFKYDPMTNSLLWDKTYDDSSRGMRIFEPAPGSDYLLLMELNGNPPSPGGGEDLTIQSLDRNTGAMTSSASQNFTLGSADSYLSGALHNGRLYTSGRYTVGASIGNFRYALSCFDLNGNEVWSKLSHVPVNSSARLYGIDLLIENQEIISIGAGDDNGTSITTTNFFLQKNDLDGNLIWTKKYEIPSMDNEWAAEVVSTLDGFIIMGFDWAPVGDIFVIKTDKNGDLMWAKSYGDIGDEAIYNWCDSKLIAAGNFIYFTGFSDSFNGSKDALLVKMDSEGNLEDDCLIGQDIDVIITDVANPSNEDVDLTEYPNPLNEITINASPEIANVPFQGLEGCECIPEQGCDTTFLKIYGTLQDNEVSHAVVAVPVALGGGFLLGGGKADSAMITLVDPAGDIIWTRSFDATFDAEDFIWDVKFDSDNNVIGVGNTKNEPQNNIECFAFKYNLVTNTMLWINELDIIDPAHENYYSILEKTAGGNYVVSGQTNELGTSTTGCNGILIELDRNSGANVWQSNMDIGSCETFSKIITANGSIYATGRYNFDGGGTARMRPGITRFDFSGNQIWSRFYLKGPSPEVARLYSWDILDDNGLVVFGHGDGDGTVTDVNELFIFKTDYDGNILWARQYDIPGSLSERARRMINLPDGYLCLGHHDTGDRDAYVFKIDKQGNLQWSKNYGDSNGDEEAWDMLWQGGQIYFTGKTTSPTSGASEDIYLANISADGSTTAQDSCNLFTEIDMTQDDWQNPYDGQHDLTDLNQNWNQFLSTATMGETAVQTTIECFIPCLDSCDLVPEAVFENAAAVCNGVDLTVRLEICNTGNFDLPAGTPVTIYDSDPTAGAATAIATLPLPDAVEDMDCDTLDLAIPGLPNITYFILINDDGTTATPIDLTIFEGLEMECDYTNNIGSFRYDYTAPTLDLGPDTSMCQFGVVDLDAGFGFISYNWQDGSTERTLTAWNPGTYSVTVVDECGGEQMDSITISIDPTTVLDLGDDVEVCQGGSHTFDVTGFTVYEWLPTDYLDCFDCPNPTTTPQADITYTLVATNADGCISVDSVMVNVLPGFNVMDSIEICEGDTVVVFGNPVDTAGVFTETFTSTGGCDSIHTIVVTLLPAIHVIADAVICEGDTVEVFGMPVFEAGEFTQTFTGQNGCDSIFTISVGVLENVFTEETISICFGETVDIFGVPTSMAGVYEMTFTGLNTCDSTHTITLEINDEFFIDFQKTDVNCFGGMDGSLTAMASGGSSGFSFVWEDGSTNPVRDSLAAGSYSCTVTDSTGCTAEASIEIDEPSAIDLMVGSVTISCSDLGNAAAVVMGGTGSFGYLWSNGETTMGIMGVPAGIYSVTVTDENGCTAVDSVDVITEPTPSVSIIIDQSISESDPNSGQLTANVSGGTAPFTYNWNNGETTATIHSLPSGNYTVTVTDDNGCTATSSVQLFLAACTGGKIWNDLDRNGCQDGGELGIAGVVLTLSGTDIFGNAVTGNATSAINGEYIFENLPPGDYQVHINVPTDYTLTTPDACSDDFTDSDFNSNGDSYVVELTEGHCCLIVDGGLYESCLNVTDPGTICCDQVLCGPGNDPDPITTASPATGANSIMYMWIYSHEPGSASLGNATWHMVTDIFGNPVMTASYDPGPLSQTTYFARCVKSATCNTWLETNVVEIKVEDDAVALIDEPGAICVGDEITFTAAPNGPNATYYWHFGPYATPSSSSAQSPTVVWSQPGYISISLTVTDNNCVSKDVQLIAVSDNPTYCGTSIISPDNNQGFGMQMSDFSGRIDVFPNPVGDILNVSWENELEMETTIEIISITGQQLRRLRLPANTHSTKLDVSDLEAGVYLLKLRTGDGEVSVVRLVKR